MSGCTSLGSSASLAAALRSVDCQSSQATAYAFGRLFGADGRLLPALTLLLTLYVAFFAIGLLTGRTRMGVGALTPRMMTLGVALTFATSWAAYQNVVWTLAIGAPDQVAGIITGSHGSATTAFADRLDRLFTLVSDAADQASRPAAPTETGIAPATTMVGGFTAATVLSLASVMLLLGTVGVLVTSKIALAALLALGPLFIILALFPGTRGLFEGWLKAVVLLAVVPLLAVLIGGGAVLALEPVARAIAMEGAQPSTRAVGVLFLGAAVYLALMVMALRTGTILVGNWQIPGHIDRDAALTPGGREGNAANATRYNDSADRTVGQGDERVRTIVAGLAPHHGSSLIAMNGASNRRMAEVVTIDGRAIDGSTSGLADRSNRAQRLGSRFSPRPTTARSRRIS